MFNPLFQPYTGDHTIHYARLKHEVYTSMAQGDYKYAAIASQLLKTNYNDFIIKY